MRSASDPSRLERGTGKGAFTISLDFELIWAALHWQGPEPLRAACAKEHAEVVDRLLDLFVEFEIPATWCIVGHLFLGECKRTDGRKHPEIVRPALSPSRRDCFEYDPCTDENRDPIFYGGSLVRKILDCPVPQEIGSHSFSHVIFTDPGCSRETARSELAECVRLAREIGVEMRSFVFPRNEVAHLEVLREFGFACYRGREPYPYLERQWPVAIERLAHLWDVLTAATPPVVAPQSTASGLWNVPGSMIYFPMHGFRRFIPLSLRVNRAKKGLDAAARQKRLFHLWFHPTNMAEETDRMFEGLREICRYAAELRSRGLLDFSPMGNVPALFS